MQTTTTAFHAGDPVLVHCRNTYPGTLIDRSLAFPGEWRVDMGEHGIGIFAEDQIELATTGGGE